VTRNKRQMWRQGRGRMRRGERERAWYWHTPWVSPLGIKCTGHLSDLRGIGSMRSGWWWWQGIRTCVETVEGGGVGASLGSFPAWLLACFIKHRRCSGAGRSRSRSRSRVESAVCSSKFEVRIQNPGPRAQWPRPRARAQGQGPPRARSPP
jgi:hypothetical protein